MFSDTAAKKGVTFPKGFKAAGVKAGIKKSGNLDVARNIDGDIGEAAAAARGQAACDRALDEHGPSDVRDAHVPDEGGVGPVFVRTRCKDADIVGA